MPITTPAQLAIARRVHQQITTYPRSHRQANYWKENECGTAACIAGWTCILDGLVPIPDPAYSFRAAYMAAYPGEQPVFMEDHAREALGLTYAEANNLFQDWSEDTAVTYLADLIDAATTTASRPGSLPEGVVAADHSPETI